LRSWIWISIPNPNTNDQINADPDAQHCFLVPGEVGDVKNISEGRDHLQLIQDLASARRSDDQQSLALSTVQDIYDKKQSPHPAEYRKRLPILWSKKNQISNGQ
jgi:hypothetical protein